jgi:hypothetical protein
MKISFYKLINFFSLSSVFYNNLSSRPIPIIENLGLPLCVNCIHFIQHQNNYPYDPVPDNSDYGKCKMFGEVDLITGDVQYDYAKDCRNNIRKCGINGSKYKEKVNIISDF